MHDMIIKSNEIQYIYLYCLQIDVGHPVEGFSFNILPYNGKVRNH